MTPVVRLDHVGMVYGGTRVLEDVTFTIEAGDYLGIIGPNGSGKTTLFRMITGEESPDEGELTIPKRLTIGYFRQDVEEMRGRSVLDEAIAGSGRAGELHHELEALQRDMEDPDKADQLDRVLERFGRGPGGIRTPRRLHARSTGARGAARTRIR